jgi:hypothetical protein
MIPRFLITAGVLHTAAHEVLGAFLPLVSQFRDKGFTFCAGRWPSPGAQDLMGKDSTDDPDLTRLETELQRLASEVQGVAKQGSSWTFSCDCNFHNSMVRCS